MHWASIVLAGVASVFMLKPEMIIDSNTENKTLRMLLENARLIGVGLMIIAFYLYTTENKKNKPYSPVIDELSADDLTSSVPSELPTYEQSELTGKSFSV